ncbi:hypothetical protein [Paenibacillus taichungensis]|uniref:hypothetical protein n=1 Tax=Paenibacillus taichungensis TaxID=484184 RepID=UPI0039A283E3
MDALALKQKLRQIQSANLSAHEVEHPYEMALHMMQHIGSPDPVLRDELIYVTFATWIGQGVFSEEQLSRCYIWRWMISIFFMVLENKARTVCLPEPSLCCSCLQF